MWQILCLFVNLPLKTNKEDTKRAKMTSHNFTQIYTHEVISSELSVNNNIYMTPHGLIHNVIIMICIIIEKYLAPVFYNKLLNIFFRENKFCAYHQWLWRLKQNNDCFFFLVTSKNLKQYRKMSWSTIVTEPYLLPLLQMKISIVFCRKLRQAAPDNRFGKIREPRNLPTTPIQMFIMKTVSDAQITLEHWGLGRSHHQ